ncbi:MAG TPA: hypothetical protein DCY88_05300, partial [Cyanobacteria bacterium UBA11372]|nr:hypothetical protein [Cyanobacteria bacterium UBA11372]
TSVSSAGDVNGDGLDDLIIGAWGADFNGTNSGSSYVVFGSKSGFSSSLNLSSLNGSNGFAINGIAADDGSGTSVSSAGDVNGDGIDDLIIGAWGADPNGISNSGQSYVVFGSKSGFGAIFNLSNLNGYNGFAINGIAVGDGASSVSSAGDVNGDGFGDVIIGAAGADPNGSNSGQSYVVFGFATPPPVVTNQPPVAVNDAVSTHELYTLNGNLLAANPTSSDNDPNNDTLTVTAVNGNPSNVGTTITLTSGALLSVNPNGTFSYNPNGKFVSLVTGVTATESFTYTISDGKGGTSSATATVTINGFNNPPVAVSDTTTTPQNTPLNIPVATLLANDTDVDSSSLSITAVSPGVGGTVTLNNNGTTTISSDDFIVFSPNNDFTGKAGFNYILSDGNTSNMTTVTVNVTAASNLPPVAINDAVSTNEDTILNGNVLAANPTTPDSDPDNDT